jgi:hypothetical protein
MANYDDCPRADKVRIVRSSPVTTKDKLYQRDRGLALLQGGAGLVLLILPIIGLLPAQGIGFWIVVVIGLGLLGSGVWFGLSVSAYLRHRRLQDNLSEALASKLGDDYIYFRNLTLPGQRSVGEIDGILLGPPGAIVMQLENYQGEYAIEGDTWYRYGRGKTPMPEARPFSNTQIELEQNQTRRRLEDSPTWSAIRAAREVKAWLSVRGLPQVVVHPLVVLGSGKIRSLKRPSAMVIEFGTIEQFISDTLLLAESEPLAGEMVEQIANRLQSNGD